MFKNQKSPSSWSKIVNDYESSGLGKAEFCKLNKVNVNQFYYWCAKLRPDLKTLQFSNSNSKSDFISIKEPIVSAPASFSMKLSSGLELHFDNLPDTTWVANLISTLASSHEKH